MYSRYMNIYPSQHFVQRCKDRGIVKSDVTALYRGMVWAATEGKDKYCEPVKRDGESGRQWYRFRCLDGFVYAPMFRGECGRILPATIFTRDQWKIKRCNIKFKARKCRSSKRYAKG